MRMIITVSVPPDLLTRFDTARGGTPRSTLIQELMRDFLEGEDLRG